MLGSSFRTNTASILKLFLSLCATGLTPVASVRMLMRDSSLRHTGIGPDEAIS